MKRTVVWGGGKTLYPYSPSSTNHVQMGKCSDIGSFGAISGTCVAKRPLFFDSAHLDIAHVCPNGEPHQEHLFFTGRPYFDPSWAPAGVILPPYLYHPIQIQLGKKIYRENLYCRFCTRHFASSDFMVICINMRCFDPLLETYRASYGAVRLNSKITFVCSVVTPHRDTLGRVSSSNCGSV